MQIIINKKTIRRVPKKKAPVYRGPKTRINEQIRAFQVRVVSEEGSQLGVMSSLEALNLAKEQSLDLVEIAPKAQPPVCKIMDYGKFQYQQSKQDRLNKAKQKKIDIKEIRIGLKTDSHDLEFKKNQAEKFLKKSDKVKVEIFLRGREKTQQDLARKTLEEFLRSIETPFKTEQEIKRFPSGFNSIIVPE